jgi:uncharacterized MnhB-related membrane protein
MNDSKDWFIMLAVAGATAALIALAFKHPDAAIAVAVCGAVPTMLGLYHWFTIRDDKEKDNNR